jgi:glyoxylase-like metal-dependent hydrolase (beta-lactamase superfamily II)
MIEIKSFEFNPFKENSYVLYDETKEAIVIDPGCYEKQEQEQLSGFVSENDLKVVKLLNTHGHIDHVFGNQWIKDFYNVKLYIHPKDEETLRAVKVYAPAYGFANYNESSPDGYLEEGDQVTFGNTTLDILFTPGHAPGHIVFFNKEQNICIGGDVLFDGSIGRTDLPGGDHDTLIQSIHEKIFPLGDDMIVYTGHGDPTRVGKEKISNPFCALK